MDITHYKNSSGNWISIANYDILVDIKDGIDRLLENDSVIECGEYRFIDNPQTGITQINTNYDYTYLMQDIYLHNPKKAIRSYKITVPQNKIILGSTEVSFSLNPEEGTVIYENGVWTDTDFQYYQVTMPIVVSKEFYNWWQANTIKI